ncbi:hypothetical protein L3Q82_010682 [Scortum barcoo]|uniref:Uncharacterized protein n=1 Tax=Scortum barcoo TaxID=214431 RepID=A0ACB8WD36_9TELE|nr:hypothetical protein L3Q82_010682 [Scortum barcoo]
MDNWKIQLFVVTFCALVQTYQALSSTAEEERWLSKDWQDESLEVGLTHPMASLMKRSKALRFYGLMGKRSGEPQHHLCIKAQNATMALVFLNVLFLRAHYIICVKKPFQVNRRNCCFVKLRIFLTFAGNKGEMFVGLMGRSTSSGGKTQ